MRFCSIEMGSFYLDIIKDLPVHRERSEQRGASLAPDCAVSHRRSTGALDGAIMSLHRG